MPLYSIKYSIVWNVVYLCELAGFERFQDVFDHNGAFKVQITSAYRLAPTPFWGVPLVVVISFTGSVPLDVPLCPAGHDLAWLPETNYACTPHPLYPLPQAEKGKNA